LPIAQHLCDGITAFMHGSYIINVTAFISIKNLGVLKMKKAKLLAIYIMKS
jgi:hypothetical protein